MREPISCNEVHIKIENEKINELWMRLKKRMTFEEKKALEKELAEEVEKAYNLPSLEGSEKQIAWARTLRARAICFHLSDARIANQFDEFLPHVIEKTDSKFWIETSMWSLVHTRWWQERK